MAAIYAHKHKACFQFKRDKRQVVHVNFSFILLRCNK